jgi:hypothetical protein
LDDKTDDKNKSDDLNVIVEVEFVVFSATDSPVFRCPKLRGECPSDSTRKALNA